MTETDRAWTIDQLAESVAAALSSDYPGQTNGRVREIPDIRTIRWYTSIGLMDRPAAMRGRTALYTRRHLVQVVAVKRLQAGGHSLADVQRQLIGADDATLEDIAQLPEQFGIAAALANDSGPTSSRARFWSAPAESTLTVSSSEPRSAPPTLTVSALPATPSPSTIVQGVRLADDVTLVLSGAGRALDASALAAIERAAGPLLDLLRSLGLAPS